MRLKSIIYNNAIILLRLFWRLSGGRKIRAFGCEIVVAPDTTFPSYRKLRLPTGGCLSEIVKYGDYVQMHAVCNYVSDIKAAPVVIDVGAHHGAYAVLMGKIVQHQNGKVIAVEPNPESFKILVDNVRMNGLENVVICEQLAVSDRAGVMNLAVEGSQSRLAQTKTKISIPVEVVTLRELFKKHRVLFVDLLIVDVEGAELPVLRGFPWESVRVSTVFCELHPHMWSHFNYSGVAMRKFLSERGYRCFDMYFKEHSTFDCAGYIGPTRFVPENKFAE